MILNTLNIMMHYRQLPPQDTLAVDLMKIKSDKIGKPNVQSRKTPRDYQRIAVDKVIKGFKSSDRGQLIMPCGTGKTLTSFGSCRRTPRSVNSELGRFPEALF